MRICSTMNRKAAKNLGIGIFIQGRAIGNLIDCNGGTYLAHCERGNRKERKGHKALGPIGLSRSRQSIFL